MCETSRRGSSDGMARHSEAVSKLRRDELHESPIVRKSPKKSGTRVTRPSELKVLRQSRSDAPYPCGFERSGNTPSKSAPQCPSIDSLYWSAEICPSQQDHRC